MSDLLSRGKMPVYSRKEVRIPREKTGDLQFKIPIPSGWGESGTFAGFLLFVKEGKSNGNESR